MKIAIIGVGTELTNGQILNRNGQWLSQRFKELGVETSLHLVVPDDRGLILSALDFAGQHADELFVTGGLGPTSDDFTRELICQWTGLKSIFDPTAWLHVQQRLSSRGVPVRESQRQQCYFPETAKILTNRRGTAHGFSLRHQNQRIYVLPGPPNEIEVLWQDHLKSEFEERCRQLDKVLTRSWDCLGLGESEIAHLTDTALAEARQQFQFEIGYRVHLPYVEVKLSYKTSEAAGGKIWSEKIDSALTPYVVLRDFADAAALLCKKFKDFPEIQIFDNLSDGSVLNRLQPFLNESGLMNRVSFLSGHSGVFPLKKVMAQEPRSKRRLHLGLQAGPACSARLYFETQNQRRSEIVESPYLTLAAKERDKKYFTERALLFWLKQLAQ